MSGARAALDRLPWRYYVGHGLGRLSGLVVLPVLSRETGPEGLGRYEVALAVMLAATIVLDAGIGSAVIRYAQDPEVARRELLGAAGVVQAAAAVVAAVAFVPLMLVLGPEGEPVWPLLLALALFAVVESAAVLGSGILRSEGDDRRFLALSASRFAIVAVAGSGGAVLAGVPGALAGVAIGGAGFAAFALRRWVAARSLGTTAVRGRVARYGLPLMATTMAMWSMSLSDRLFLQHAVSGAELGRYSANYRLGSVVLTFVAAPLIVAWFAEAHRTPVELRARRARAWTRGFSLAALPAAAALAGGSYVLVPAIFGGAFEADPLIVGLVGLSGWLAGLHYLLATPMVVADGTARLAAVAAAAFAATLILNALLIPRWGAEGAAAATVLAYGTLCALTGLAARRAPGRASAA